MKKSLVHKWISEAFDYGSQTEMAPDQAHEKYNNLEERIDKYFKKQERT